MEKKGHFKENPNSLGLERPRSERPYEKTSCVSAGVDDGLRGLEGARMDFSGVHLLTGQYSTDRRRGKR